MEKIKVVVTDDGVVIEAEGFIGPACIKETERILDDLAKLGIEVNVTDTKLKPEYYAKVTDKESVRF